MTSAATPTPVPGQSAPLAVITSTDQSGVIYIVTAIGVAIALVSLLIRVYVRSRFNTNRFAWDDGFVLAAFTFAVFQNACVFLAAQKGMGKTIHQIDSHSLIEIQKAGYAGDILYIVSVWLTKISTICLCLRLSPKKAPVLASKVVSAVTAATALASILILALRCNLSHPWININSKNAQCSGLFTRWQTVAAFDISLEILIFVIVVMIFQPLQVSVAKKTGLMLAFGSRLLLVIPIAMRLHYLAPALNSSNYTLDGTLAVICQQAEISYAIVAATIPCLRPFMTATVTHYGGAAEGHMTKGASYGIHSKSSASSNSKSQEQQGGLRLNNLTSRLSGNRNTLWNNKKTLSSQIESVGAQGKHTASVTAGGGAWVGDADKPMSSESTEVMIRKEFQCTVEYDSGNTIEGEHGHKY